MSEMIFPGSALYKDIFKENQKKLPKNWLKDVVHETLECAGSISKTERHNEVFVIVYIFMWYSELMETNS